MGTAISVAAVGTTFAIAQAAIGDHHGALKVLAENVIASHLRAGPGHWMEQIRLVTPGDPQTFLHP